MREKLCELVEPSDVFISILLRKKILLDAQCKELRCKVTVYEKNDLLLTYLLDESFPGGYSGLLDVLIETGQEHIVNFVTSNGGSY